MIRRIGYYLSSVPTILGQIRNWYVCFGLLLNRQPVVIRLRNGCRFKVRSLMDVWVVKETCLDRDYEANAIPIRDGWTILDIGAGLGDFAISVAYEHPRCQVYAYEPFPESYRLLEENIGLNATNNVIAAPIAVGAKSGQMTLFATGAAVQHTTTSVSGQAETIAVQGLSLDDVFEENALTTCNFLKMDCEGGEFDILLNASETTLEKIGNICLEYHNGVSAISHQDLGDYLQQRGFQVKTVPNPVHSHLGLLYAYRELERK
ncbi:MAG: FkbM family methyltransferase [Anaerolineae bacterium]|nr:FkbM family methyltransferase [Anaerolineae bacterium]